MTVLGRYLLVGRATLLPLFVLLAVQPAHSSQRGTLTSQERANIGKLENALRAVMAGDDYQAIRTAIDALNQGTMRLAELMMDTAVSTALKGKTMDTADVGDGPASPHPIAQAEIKK